jgi:hypothetical protein
MTKKVGISIAIILLLLTTVAYSVVVGLVIVSARVSGQWSSLQIRTPYGWKSMWHIGDSAIGTFLVDGDQTIEIRGLSNSTGHDIALGYATSGEIQYLRANVAADGQYDVKATHFP